MYLEMGTTPTTGYGERFGQRTALTRAQLAAQLRRALHEYDALLDGTGRLTHVWIADEGGRGHFEAATQEQTLDHELIAALGTAKSEWRDARGTEREADLLAAYNAARNAARDALRRANAGRFG